MPKTNIKALILDYGGVISLPQSSVNVRYILEALSVERDEFREIYLEKRKGYDSGQLSGAEYWLSILQHFDINPENMDINYLIQEDVRSWTNINQDMIAFLEDSKSKLQYLAMISNMTADSLTFIKTHFRWLRLFDLLVFSNELGINKPDQRIYQVCLQKIPITPGECLFVDDSLENVNAALQVGMNAIQFSSYPEFMADLNAGFHLTS